MRVFFRQYEDLKRVLSRYFQWLVLAACLLGLLIYGLTAFTAKPTVETITTHAPVFNSNNDQLREVDYSSPRRARRR
ncbi:MAG: hypothetical protein JSS81_27215 [Acidobacteria bacterium]|nr:hypothetical protein [Acidobacteriota bacterium]